MNLCGKTVQGQFHIVKKMGMRNFDLVKWGKMGQGGQSRSMG